jgi:hypothetical protein
VQVRALITSGQLPGSNRGVHNSPVPVWDDAPVMISIEDPVSVALIQYGAVGAIAIMALYAVRVLFNRVTEQAARADRLEDELRKLNELVRTEYLGTLAKATDAIADALAARRRG